MFFLHHILNLCIDKAATTQQNLSFMFLSTIYIQHNIKQALRWWNTCIKYTHWIYFLATKMTLNHSIVNRTIQHHHNKMDFTYEDGDHSSIPAQNNRVLSLIQWVDYIKLQTSKTSSQELQ